MINKIVYLSCLMIVLHAGQAAAAGDASAGARKVQTCQVCHGVNGNSMNPAWPKLAGQHAGYIVKQLQDFKSGIRQSPQMTPIAMPLTQQDMEDIAAYYAKQEIMETPVPASVELKTVEIGERIHRAGDADKNLPACMACHGPTAAGNPAAIYPRLSGQHAAYTAAQLQAFKNESRDNDTNAIMRDIAGKMTNGEIEAVSQYLQGLY